MQSTHAGAGRQCSFSRHRVHAGDAFRRQMRRGGAQDGAQQEVEKGEGEAGSPSANSNVPHRAFDFGRRRRALFVCLSVRRRERPRACVRAWRGSGVNILACSGWRVGRTCVRGARASTRSVRRSAVPERGQRRMWGMGTGTGNAGNQAFWMHESVLSPSYVLCPVDQSMINSSRLPAGRGLRSRFFRA